MGVTNLIQLYVGDMVRRMRPWDGSATEGQPAGPLLTIKKIYPHEPYAICELSDGRSEFECNLEKYEISLSEEAA